MPNATAQFFADLEQNPHQPLLRHANGSLRFEITGGENGDPWRLEIHHGEVSVSRDAGPSDCLLRAPKPLFDKIFTGRENAFTAGLRGALVVEGDPELLLQFGRILPGPPRPAGKGRRNGR